MRNTPKLLIIVPCYNEEEILPLTGGIFREELDILMSNGLVAKDSGILFVDDGSSDGTWECISRLAASDPVFMGVRQSRNRGHQYALWAGLMEARRIGYDVTVTIDSDCQDDIKAIEAMVAEYMDGAEVVYGVRNDRTADTFFKRFTAACFYRFQILMGIEILCNHADYRLLSAAALDALSRYREVNLYLRGLIPLVGFRNARVEYLRGRRVGGASHYSVAKMLSLAADGITSMSLRPLRAVILSGVLLAILGLSVLIFALAFGAGAAVTIVASVFFVGGCNMFAIGIVGEYVGKTYMEAKGRPKDVISDRTFDV